MSGINDYALRDAARSGDELTEKGIPPLRNEFHIDNLMRLVNLLEERNKLSRRGAALLKASLVENFTFNPIIKQTPRETPYTSLFQVAAALATANILFPPEQDPFAGVRDRYEARYP